MADRPVRADDPSPLVVDEEDACQLRRGAAGLPFPLLTAVRRFEDRAARPHRPTEIGVPEIDAHERDFRPGLLWRSFDVWIARRDG